MALRDAAIARNAQDVFIHHLCFITQHAQDAITDMQQSRAQPII